MQEKQLQLVTYEQAKKLKELGFNWECYCHYTYLATKPILENGKYWNSNRCADYECKYSAPTVALALKWFRDVKGIVNGIKRENIDDCDLIEYCGHFNDMYITDFTYTYYEEAESALLDALLEHCEQEVKNA